MKKFPHFFKNINTLRLLLLLVFSLLSRQAVLAQGPVCATPGADGVQQFPKPQNSFFPGFGDNITVPAGTTSFQLDPIPDPFLVGGVLYDFGNSKISKGDLLLIVQMQGATINYTDTNAYGSGSSSSGGSGYSNLNNVGRYEYMVALNSVTSSGGLLRFRASGTGGGLLYSYVNAAASSTNGVMRFQVIRLNQFSDLTLTSDVVTTPWNGKAGGLIAIDVAGTLDFNGKTINASITGFRGGYLPSRGIQNQQYTNYVSSVYGENNAGSSKGEGIAGTPRYVWDGYVFKDHGSAWVGYPGGDLNKGAPGNAGGGGNVHNAGGGGGGNGGFGGAGGYGWPLSNTSPQSNNTNSLLSLQTGGRPGVAMPSNVSNGLLFLGGGGGAGDANNSSNGARGGVGGGLIFITANKIKGSGFIIADGGKGEPGSVSGSGDGAGGGGGGGSIFINVKEPSPSATLFLRAKGGNGGNSTTTDLHGPGGGGGGGIIYYNVNGAAASTDVSRGEAGLINSGDPVNGNNYADFPVGANKLQNGSLPGQVGISKSFTPQELPSYLAPSAYCYPALTINKWRVNPLDSIPAGSVITYKIRINNTGGGAKGIRINDVLPGSFQFVSATIDFDTTTGNPITLANIGSTSIPVLGTFDLVSGEGANVEMLVQVPFNTPIGTYHNGVQVGYLDPTRAKTDPLRVIYPPTNALAGQNTSYAEGIEAIGGSNYAAHEEGEEVVVKKPDIAIQKTINLACEDVANGNVFSIVLLNPNPVVLNNIPVTDIIDSELNVESVSGAGWTSSFVGNTYTLTLGSLAAGSTGTPFASAPVLIRVKRKAGSTKVNWPNTATVPNPKGGTVSSSVVLHRVPDNATATLVSFTGADCDTGVYYVEGNIPVIGTGQWQFVGNPYLSYFENPTQHDTRILGLAPGETIGVRWVITNGSCTPKNSSTISISRPLRPTAVISGGGTLCAGAPITSAQNISIALTGTSPWRIKYLDGAGFERIVTHTSSTYTFTPTYSGVHTLIEVKSGGTGDANNASWTSICPGIVSGIARVNLVSEAPTGGVINYFGGPVCRGEIVPMSLMLTGQSGRVLGWRSSTNGTTWSGIISGTENLTSYSPVVANNIYYVAELGSIEVNGTPCFPSKYSASVYITVKDCNDISITKTVNNATPDVGNTITFTITATNNKQQNATNVKVFDEIPNGYTYTGSHIASVGSYTAGVWNIGTLNAGQSRTLSITVTVNAAGQYTNKAIISCDEQETNYANNTSESTPVPNCDVRNISPKVN